MAQSLNTFCSPLQREITNLHNSIKVGDRKTSMNTLAIIPDTPDKEGMYTLTVQLKELFEIKDGMVVEGYSYCHIM